MKQREQLRHALTRSLASCHNSKCKELLNIIEFGKNVGMKDGLRYDCKACVKSDNMAYRRTKEGYLRQKYLNMVARVEGRGPKNNRHIYMGLPICTWNEFIFFVFS